jgi:hypothetical protein
MRVTYPVKRYRDADFIECKVEITEDNLHDISERPSQSSHHTTTTSPLRMSSRSFPSPSCFTLAAGDVDTIFSQPARFGTSFWRLRF